MSPHGDLITVLIIIAFPVVVGLYLYIAHRLLLYAEVVRHNEAVELHNFRIQRALARLPRCPYMSRRRS